MGIPFRYTVLNRVPTIQVLSPNGDESYLDEVIINWSASDPDNDILRYTISYNLACTGWRLLATNLSGNSYVWNITSLSYCETVTIRVEVSDGYGGYTFDVCDYVFTVGEMDTNTDTTTTDSTTPTDTTSSGTTTSDSTTSGESTSDTSSPPPESGLEPMSIGIGIGIGGIAAALVLMLVIKKRP